jgi:predicted amidohydrolase
MVVRRWTFLASMGLACGDAATPVADTGGATSSSGVADPTGANDGDPSTSNGGSSSGDTTHGAMDSSSTAADSTGAPTLPPAIGLVQYDGDAHFGDAATNLANLTAWAEQAVSQGAKIVVFPEGSTYGYASTTELWCAPGLDAFEGRSCRDVSTVAEALPGGPTAAYWAAFAAEHDVVVVFHVPEVDGDTFYASLGVVDPTGYVTRYRKRSLYYVDAAYATAGDTAVILDTAWGRFGLMICLDATYDGDYYDTYVEAGVDGIILSMDWDDDPHGEAAAITWFRERAAVNGLPIYGSDVSTWDGTGLYPPGDVPRERNGLPPVAVGVDGISVHAL